MRTWEMKVVVTPMADEAEWDREDREDSPVGEHLVFVDAIDAEAANVRALDEFHATVPISNLDCFDIDVHVVGTGPDFKPWRDGQMGRERPVIEVEARLGGAGYVAKIDGRPGFGQTPAEAVGNVVIQNAGALGLQVALPGSPEQTG